MLSAAGTARSGGRAPSPSKGILFSEQDKDRLDHYLQIELQRPISQVMEIMLDAGLHLVERIGLPAQTVDLSQPGDSRPDLVPDHVALDQAAVHLVVRHRVGARADDAHAALEHIEKLRQLVERGLPQKRAEAGYAPVVARGLLDHIPIFENGHRAELVDDDLLAVESVAELLEQYRPGRSQLYADRDDKHDRQDQHRARPGD